MRLGSAIVAAGLVVAVSAGALAETNDRTIERLSPIPLSLDRIEFEAGSAGLTDEAKAILDRQAAILLAFPNDKPTLVGHADPYEAGSRQDAVELGLARAIATGNYLIAKGVAASRLRLDSRGSDFIVFTREPTERALAGMRYVTTEIAPRPIHN